MLWLLAQLCKSTGRRQLPAEQPASQCTCALGCGLKRVTGAVSHRNPQEQTGATVVT